MGLDEQLNNILMCLDLVDSMIDVVPSPEGSWEYKEDAMLELGNLYGTIKNWQENEHRKRKK